MSAPRIAFVYDRVTSFGGAERVLMVLHTMYPDAVLYTAVYDSRKTPWASSMRVIPSGLNRVPFSSHHEWFGWAMPLAFESLDIRSVDIIVSMSSEAAKGVITRTDQLHVCYCLTPTRYLWSHTYAYGQGKLSLLKQVIFSWLRQRDYIQASRPDAYIAISKRVAGRIAKYYRRPVTACIAPPVEERPMYTAQRSQFLVVSRLVPYKRVDHAIMAALSLSVPLTIVGTGSDGARLRRLAAGSSLIRFAGRLSDEEVAQAYASSWALLCPQEEDFGIVSLEAQLQGTPVISYQESGVAETVIAGKTGLLYPIQSVADLAACMQRGHKMDWDHAAIRQHALKYTSAVFTRTFHDTLSRLWHEHTKSILYNRDEKENV